MKTQYYTVEYLKALYPDLEYVDDILYFGEEVIQENAKQLIEDHYDGWTVAKGHSSGNPELNYDEKVSGAEYIEYEFFGDYNEAWNQI